MSLTYEIEPVMEDEGIAVPCDECHADYWSLRERPTTPDESGWGVAVWVADFARKEDALNFKELLEST